MYHFRYIRKISPLGHLIFSDLLIPGFSMNFESMDYPLLPILPCIRFIQDLELHMVCFCPWRPVLSGHSQTVQVSTWELRLKSQIVWVQIHFCPSLAMWLWVSYVTDLCLSFLICKQEVFRFFFYSLHMLIHIKQWLHRISSKQSLAIIISSTFLPFLAELLLAL